MASAASVPPLFLFLLAATAGTCTAASTMEVTLEFTSRCPYRVWPAIVPGRQGLLRELPGMEQGNYFGFLMPVDDGGPATHLWARTGCRFGRAGRGHCRTGDCGGLRHCENGGGNNTVPAEPDMAWRAGFSLYEGRYYYGITTLNGFNVPVKFSCSTGDAVMCKQAGCHDAYPYQKYYQHECTGGKDVRFRVVFCPQ